MRKVEIIKGIVDNNKIMVPVCIGIVAISLITYIPSEIFFLALSKSSLWLGLFLVVWGVTVAFTDKIEDVEEE